MTTEPTVRLTVNPPDIIRLPSGLLGFEHLCAYVLLADPAEAPFLWLQVLDDPRLAFLVVPPLSLLPQYRPELSDDDVRSLALERPEDASVLCVVTVRGPHEATMNLKGPIIVNRRTQVGRQVIPLNAADFSVEHPLPLARS
ncbi:MAG: flagellar assembly protein FliW [Verrucomicrobiales bacterium]|nr:flagellar assembly protein FliW [Verrucomicrobiales bacterium]